MITFIISVILTSMICKVINRNTIGTTGAYAKRTFTVWVVCLFILLGTIGVI